MGWKDWPYWLKGGIIALVLCFILIVAQLFIIEPAISTIDKQTFGAPPKWVIVYFIVKLFFIMGPIAVLSFLKICKGLDLDNSTRCLGSSLPDSGYSIVALVFYFILGVFLGWIYGKIKSRLSNSA